MAVMVDGALLDETRERVLAWFGEAARDLPWRATRDPYRVLVAEVRAPQTPEAAGGPGRAPVPGAVPGRPRPGRGRPGRGPAGLAGAGLQPAGAGPAPHRPGGRRARGVGGAGRGG